MPTDPEPIPAPPGQYATPVDALDYVLDHVIDVSKTAELAGDEVHAALEQIGWHVAWTPPDNVVTANYVTTGHPELDALQAFAEWLGPFDGAARQRMLAYLADRFAPREDQP